MPEGLWAVVPEGSAIASVFSAASSAVRGVAVAIPILLVAFAVVAVSVVTIPVVTVAVVAVSVVTIPVVAPVKLPEKLVAVTIPVVKMLS